MTKCFKKILFSLFLIAIPASGFCTKFNWQELAYELNHHPEKFDLTEIEGGTTNKNFHLSIANREFFVRMPLSESAELGANLSIEYRILNLLNHSSFTPTAYFYSDEQNLMITEFLLHDDTTLDFDLPSDREILISIVKSIHEAGAFIDHHFNPYEEIKSSTQYAKSLGIQLPNSFDSKLPKILDTIEKSSAFHFSSTLCHHDIHPGNILKRGDRYILVDWEYGAMSDPLYEIASIASIAFWNTEEMLQFLKEYDPESSLKDVERLVKLRLLADIRWYVWCEIQKHFHPNDPIYVSWSNLYLENIELNPLYLNGQ